MRTRWSLLVVWSCLAACSGSSSGDKNNSDASTPAADSGTRPDSGGNYDGDEDAGPDTVDAGPDAAAEGGKGGAGGRGGSGGAGGRGGAGGSGGGSSDLDDVASAECRSDPTDFAACGGDVKGEWRVASICLRADVDDLRKRLMCEELTQDFSYDYRMLIDFKSSGNYTAVVRASAMQTVLMPFSCLPEEAEGDCRAALGEDDDDDSDGRTVFVTMDDEDCVIKAQEQRSESEAGTWTVSGNKITMTNALGPRSAEYCVSGDSLVVRNVNTATNVVSWGVFERL